MFFGSQTALESSDRFHIAAGPITSKYYKLGASGNHPGNFSSGKSDFLVVEVTYNHRLYHWVLHIWSKNQDFRLENHSKVSGSTSYRTGMYYRCLLRIGSVSGPSGQFYSQKMWFWVVEVILARKS